MSALAIVASAQQFVRCPPVTERPVYDLVKDFGAVGDNTTLNTQAFQNAIAAISQAGGGELRVGPGIFLTAPFSLTNCMKLNLYDAKSFIQAITSIADWPVGPKPTAVDDWDVDELGDTAAHAVDEVGGHASDVVYQDFISAHNVTDVMIDGLGTIDGGGYMWWGPARAGTLKYDRGVLLGVYDSQYFTLRDVQLQNSPMFNVKPYQTQHVWAERLRIFNPADSHNTDGFDPQSCNNVTLTDSYFHTGDDAVAVKTTLRPATNILVRNLTVTAGHCGMCIGSGAKGGASNISVVDSHFVSVVNGFCFKGFRGVGGTVHNYSANNIVIDWANYSAIQLTDFYPGGDNSSSVVPIVYDVRVTNMVATKVGRWPAVLRGLNDSVMTQLLFSNVTMMEWGKPYECENVQGTYENVSPSMGGGACPGITESGGERIVEDVKGDMEEVDVKDAKEDEMKKSSGLLQWAKMVHMKTKARTIAKV